MLKLYGSSRSRASIVQWYLEEINIPYEFVTVDLQAGENKQPEYLAINPIGKVPAIVDDGVKVWETGAILLYLVEKYGHMPTDLGKKAEIYQWVLFSNSTLGTGIFIEANREKETPRLLHPLNDILSRQPFLMGNDFNVADVSVGSILAYIPIMLKMDLSAYPAVLEYMQRLSDRPAFQKSIGGRA